MGVHAQKAKKLAVRKLGELNEPMDPQESPILQLIDRILLPEGSLDLPATVDLTDLEYKDLVLDKEDLPKVIDRIIDREGITIPEEPEKLRWKLAELVSLVGEE